MLMGVESTRLKPKIVLYCVYLLGFIGDFNLSLLQMSMVLYCTDLGGTTVQVGWIGTSYGLSYCFIPAIIGIFTDKIPRKKSLIIASSIQSLAGLLYIYTLSVSEIELFFPLSLVVLCIYGIGYSFYWSNVEAFISEYTENSDKEHEKGISNFCVFWGAGSALGAFVGGLLIDIDIRYASYLVTSLFVLALCICIFIIPVSSRHPEVVHLETNDSEKKKVDTKILWIILIANLMFAFISRLISSYYANYAKYEDGLNYDGTKVGNIILFFGISRIVYFYLGRFYTKTLRALAYGTLMSGFLIIFLYPTDYLWVTVVVFIFLGLLNGRLYYIALMLLMKHEEAQKSTKAGLFEAMVGIGSSTSPIIAGSLALVGLKFPFLIFSITVTIAGIVQILMLRTHK